MSLLFNMLSRLIIAFLPRSKCLLISWLQSPSAVILEPKKNKVSHCFHCFPIYLPWNYGTGCHDLCLLDIEFCILRGLIGWNQKEKGLDCCKCFHLVQSPVCLHGNHGMHGLTPSLLQPCLQAPLQLPRPYSPNTPAMSNDCGLRKRAVLFLPSIASWRVLSKPPLGFYSLWLPGKLWKAIPYSLVSPVQHFYCRL